MLTTVKDAMTTQTYQEASRQLLKQAHAQLERGDLREASGKGWAAASQMVKAVAEGRQWEHSDHAQLFTAVRRLREETDDREISRLFHVANSLNGNYFEDWLEAETVAESLDDVERFLDKVEPLLQQ